MARSRNRPQPVRLEAKAFNDSIDSHDGAGLIGGGASYSHASEAAPRSSVHRLYRLAYSGSDPLTFIRTLRGYGGFAPMQALSRSPRPRPPRAMPLLPGRLTPHPPPRSRLSADWQAFNVLRARVPARVSFCVRRKQRRETLFALGIGGRRGLGRGGVRRSSTSQWSC